MHLLLFIFYSAVLCYLLGRMPFFRQSGIRPRALLLLFGLRVAAGCLHNLAAWRFYPNHGDIWAFFQTSFFTRQELFHDFHTFLADNATWAYLPYNIIICLHVLLDFFSFDNMYINTLLFSFGVFAGSIALFRAFRGFFGNGLGCAVCTLCIPSTLYWTACIHKEGVLYLLLGFFFYYMHKALTGGWNLGRALLCLLFFCLAAFFRAGIALSLFPGLALWMFQARILRARVLRLQIPQAAGKLATRRLITLLGIILATIIIIGVTRPALFTGALSYFSREQRDFQVLKGNSRIALPSLEPRIGSFLHVLPIAVVNGFFQPLPGVGGQAVYLAFSVELILIWLIVLYASISFLRSNRAATPPGPHSAAPGLHPPTQASLPLSDPPAAPSGFALCCLVFSFSGMLMIGYIIPFVGAIIRYRSLYLPFLLVPFLYILRRGAFFRRLDKKLGLLVFDYKEKMN